MSMWFLLEGKEFILRGIKSSEVEVKAELKSLKSSFVRKQGLLLQIADVQKPLTSNLLPIVV